MCARTCACVVGNRSSCLLHISLIVPWPLLSCQLQPPFALENQRKSKQLRAERGQKQIITLRGKPGLVGTAGSSSITSVFRKSLNNLAGWIYPVKVSLFYKQLVFSHILSVFLLYGGICFIVFWATDFLFNWLNVLNVMNPHRLVHLLHPSAGVSCVSVVGCNF